MEKSHAVADLLPRRSWASAKQWYEVAQNHEIAGIIRKLSWRSSNRVDIIGAHKANWKCAHCFQMTESKPTHTIQPAAGTIPSMQRRSTRGRNAEHRREAVNLKERLAWISQSIDLDARLCMTVLRSLAIRRIPWLQC
jgi:hypothetical protein